MKIYTDCEVSAVNIAMRVHPQASSIQFIPKGFNSLNS